MSIGSFYAVGYTITLESVVCDTTTTPHEQTWTYKVSGAKLTQGGEISNWALQLGECYKKDEDIFDYEEDGGAVNDPNSGGGVGNCLKDNGEDTCGDGVDQQIKWDNMSDDILPNVFTFKLSPCYKCEPVQVAIKTGGKPGDTPKCHCGTILGPSLTCDEGNCDVPEPPTGRGLIL